MVLANRDIDRRPLFPNNLRNKPMFVVNGGRDPLYPTRVVDPYIEHLKRGGVTIDYHPQPDAGHNTAWWPRGEGHVRSVRARAPAQAAAGHADLGNAERAGAQPRALARHRSRSAPGDGRAQSLADLNEMVDAAGAGLRRAQRSARASTASMPGSNAERIGLKAGDVLVRLNDRDGSRRRGHVATRSRTISRARRSRCWSRATTRRWS